MRGCKHIAGLFKKKKKTKGDIESCEIADDVLPLGIIISYIGG
jgi:hypothetical protein